MRANFHTYIDDKDGREWFVEGTIIGELIEGGHSQELLLEATIVCIEFHHSSQTLCAQSLATAPDIFNEASLRTLEAVARENLTEEIYKCEPQDCGYDLNQP